MKLTVLTENCAGGQCGAEHGLSYLIESNGKVVLFDTGHSDLFMRNGAILGIDVQNSIDTVILSHGHWDHGDGLRFLTNKRLIAHPQIFKSRFRVGSNINIGLKLSENEITTKFNFVPAQDPFYITENILFLGEIPRKNQFESQSTAFTNQDGNPDFVPDDSALVIIENGALIVVSGCAHSGICNIISYAKEVTKIDIVTAVIGGFHLKHNNLQTQQTIAYFKENRVTSIYPSHCTELDAIISFAQHFDILQVKTGARLSF